MHLVYDLESTGIEIEDCHTIWCICAKNVYTLEEYQFGPTEIKDACNLLQRAHRLICHNQIWYDLQVLKKLAGFIPSNNTVIIDTLILSRLSKPDREKPIGLLSKTGPHSLESWGYRSGRFKPDHEDWTQWSPEMQHRCMEDVNINLMVYKALYEELC